MELPIAMARRTMVAVHENVGTNHKGAKGKATPVCTQVPANTLRLQSLNSLRRILCVHVQQRSSDVMRR
eukprot:c41832_g1_i1 orf=31-237(+)